MNKSWERIQKVTSKLIMKMDDSTLKGVCWLHCFIEYASLAL
jgi:hypothetical protein